MESGYDYDRFTKKKPQLRGADGKFESKSSRNEQDFEINSMFSGVNGAKGSGRNNLMDLGAKRQSTVFEN